LKYAFVIKNNKVLSLPKGKKEHSLWEYLEGKYKPEDPNEENQYRFIMRRRVKKDMRFLKLVLEKAHPSDLYKVFRENEREWEETMWPVASRLMSEVAIYLPSEREGSVRLSVKLVSELCEKNGLKLQIWRFLNNESYRKKKVEELSQRIPQLKQYPEWKEWLERV
jgi:hypothetical protein